VAHEIILLEQLDFHVACNMLVGRSVTIDELFAEGYDAVYARVGVGLLRFMSIPGR
jgi:glutamate synthase (NADPH/NADH) small chain